jgi:nitrogen regulatory protein PII
MREIKAICRPERLEHVLQALHAIQGVPGATVSRVEGVGRLHGDTSATPTFGRCEMTKVELVVPDGLADRVITGIEKAARTGRPGDGKVFAVRVEEAIRIRSGERGDDAL